MGAMMWECQRRLPSTSPGFLLVLVAMRCAQTEPGECTVLRRADDCRTMMSDLSAICDLVSIFLAILALLPILVIFIASISDERAYPPYTYFLQS